MTEERKYTNQKILKIRRIVEAFNIIHISDQTGYSSLTIENALDIIFENKYTLPATIFLLPALLFFFEETQISLLGVLVYLK